MIEGRHRADDADHDSHWVRITAEATEEVDHLLVDHGMVGDQIFELFKLGCRGKLAV